ncbi:tyrosine-type recombinase/integrase [Prosthecobacter dejongeii]|uniref:Integrase n=1 Tax=Prosthecobacter dejongeii TaxID=48465 RepID=A0A7W7YHE2_9BACT|nr:tyrosine-type recombinase/integrase [Prosthecobacter dejongeii]MBB5036174.1 integrase [Prosthecobacter dejongeii]
MLHDSKASPSPAPEFLKVPGIPGLYRNARSGLYLGVKRVQGKRKERSLKTNDRKIAERRLKAWIDELGRVDSSVEKTTLEDLFKRLLAVDAGKSASSIDIIEGVRNDFLGWWPYGSKFQVRNVRPSHLEEWLAILGNRVSNSSYNRYAGVLKQAFELAVKDRMIASSPFDLVKTKSKRPSPVKRQIPTIEQFEAIIREVRAAPFTIHAQTSADFLEFLGLAGVGQAEASSLCWGDIDFERGQMTFRRHKTDIQFFVPIYEHLKPLLDKLLQKAGSPVSARQRLFKIKDANCALTNACRRLKLPHFSQRNLRQCLIRRLWQAGIDRKLIAKWQGHQDGGQLILDTYTEVFGSDDADYERQQLAKLSGTKHTAP